MTHDQKQTVAVGQFAGQGLQGLGAGLHEGRTQQQVFGWVAGEGQFRRHYQLCALGVGAPCSIDQESLIALQKAAAI